MSNSRFKIPDSKLNPKSRIQDPKFSIRNLKPATQNSKPKTQNLSIYLHIPFCTRLCPFCHFYRVREVPDWRIYLEAVAREIAACECPAGGTVQTLYVGGGTPTILPPEFYNSLLDVITGCFDLAGLAEATIETDAHLSAGNLAPYAAAGFDRVSIGVKSFDPRMRRVLGTGDSTQPDPVANARSAGFSSVSLDLIYGFQGQTMESFISDLKGALVADPDHISLYMLEGADTCQPGEGDPDLTAAMFRRSARILGAGGYKQYEITNFALTGQESLHNTTYWEDGDFIGLGPSAHSSVTDNGVRTRWRNRPDIQAYLEDPLTCKEILSREEGGDRAREALILGLRLTRGVHRPSFARKYGSDPMELLGPHARELRDLGLIRFSADHVRLTTRGMLLSNEVFVKILR